MIRMSDAAIVAVISGIVTIIATLITMVTGITKARSDADARQAVIDEKITELTREVREHNNFARRLPVVENDVKTIYKRLEKLENEN